MRRLGGPVRLALLVMMTAPWTGSMPSSPKEPAATTTRRPPQPAIDDTIKQLTSQLIATNVTTTFDTRTPPRVKQQQQQQQLKKKQQQSPAKGEHKLENSHPGIAVPVDETDLVLEENTKKFTFYKIESKATTTDRGLSTWVLLNSQTVSPPYGTTKVSRKPQKPNEGAKKEAATDASSGPDAFGKLVKPLFKKRPLPTAATKAQAPTSATTAAAAPHKDHSKLTKVKASALNEAITNKSKTATAATATATATVAATTPGPSRKKDDPAEHNFLEVSTISPATKMTSTEALGAQAKDDDVDLPAATTTTPQSAKKSRRPASSQKKKKNKNRRRRPGATAATDAAANATRISNKVGQKEKPIGTQIYNYLSREIMPTVGVGLVGLMVTAGLASYFLYPFGAARRSYDIDRKDKEGAYYYSDEHVPGGVAEEEVIGKVIAGMPSKENGYYHRSASPSSSPSQSQAQAPPPGSRYRQNDGFGRQPQPQAQASVEAIYLTPSRTYEDRYGPQRNYDRQGGPEEKQFVVGNVPAEIQGATPAVVPEHGPRNMLPEAVEIGPGLAGAEAERGPRGLRKRRGSGPPPEGEDESENEVDGRGGTEETRVPDATPSTTARSTRVKAPSFVESLRGLLDTGLRMGLEFLQSTSKMISRYIADVQSRFNGYGRNETLVKEQPRVH